MILVGVVIIVHDYQYESELVVELGIDFVIGVMVFFIDNQR